ncbi:membrane fusion protein (multidrug efflux system) [Luteimonas cucumeris]|uniref:Membrane fusion protein (Multidrug efflux system) n=1 Tax=Luteimonas cucumeris TaxID=985012 RepID=A0A562LF80_9GAMM|nr:efflux RND transporter periplasmic adaptor subunit [Luteimonas cucumeris]TWI06255.1 membrane fusion protein (multidrug efflux system) [Luteimonas cucumeris]
MPSPRLFDIVLTLALCGAVAACGKETGGRGNGEAPVSVTTTVVRQQPWSDTIQALGTAKARESITVTAKVSETVQAVNFESGDVVEKGAALVTLTGNQQQAALNAAEATANEAERLLKRQEELAAQQLIARSALDTQRAIRDAARARVAQMRADLGDRVIRAPFAGVLGIRQISPGSLVTPGTAIATLDDVARMHVDFPVPEAMLAQLAVGQRLTATSAAYPGREFSGNVSIVDSRIDPVTRAVNVRGDFDNPDRALRPGMLLQVTLLRPERQALLVPEIAIVQVGNSSYVYRVKPDNSVERADVTIGSRRKGMAEVTGGLAVGDRIVVDGTGKLRVGAKIVDAATAPAGAESKNTKAATDAAGG